MERTFRVRHYECDAYGHLNNAAYLRYLEEIEFDAGVLASRACAEIRITYVQPVEFGESVVVTARSAHDEARNGPVRDYQFRRLEDAEPVATAVVEWRSAPASSTRADLAPARLPVGVFRQQRQVEWREVDASFRVGPATMVGYAEDCGVAVAAAFGWPLDRCTAAGFAMVLREHRVQFGDLPRLGDRVTVATWASNASRIAALRHYLFTDSCGEPLARFESRYVWVNPATMRPIRIPADFLADFAANFDHG